MNFAKTMLKNWNFCRNFTKIISNFRHLKLPLYNCSRCSMEFRCTSSGDARRHNCMVHGRNSLDGIIDNRAKYFPKLRGRHVWEKYFGNADTGFVKFLLINFIFTWKKFKINCVNSTDRINFEIQIFKRLLTVVLRDFWQLNKTK